MKYNYTTVRFTPKSWLIRSGALAILLLLPLTTLMLCYGSPTSTGSYFGDMRKLTGECVEVIITGDAE